MRSVRSLFLVALGTVLALASGAVAATTEGSSVACDTLDGRPVLTADGAASTFQAPVVTYPGLSAPADNSVGPESALRAAPFPFTVDLAPADGGTATLELTWDGPSDFDIFVFDDETGAEITRAADSNIDDTGIWAEQTTINVEHCQHLTARVSSWAGSPAETLSLTIDVQPAAEQLACADGDTAAGCVGKSAGEAPDPATPTHDVLYLGGAAGQTAMLGTYVSGLGGPGDDLPQSTLEPERPTRGTPNGHTRVLVGFHDQYRNPLVPHWTGELADRDIVGDVHAVLYASSRTTDDSAPLYVSLFADEVAVGQVEVPGDTIGTDPTRLVVSFADLDLRGVDEVTLQAATLPVAATSGATGGQSDAEVTLHYGSVQFPAYVSLP